MSTFRTILAPTDFSESAAHAVARAFELAATHDAKVHLVHAYQIPPFPDGATVGADVVAPLEQAATRALGLEAQKYASRPEFGGVILEMGDAREVILHHARTLPADLIVMGTHGRSGIQRWALGSVAERIVRSAPCAVLVVPPDTAPEHGHVSCSTARV
jgi:nucleotide-binding universal stress UspA family protein